MSDGIKWIFWEEEWNEHEKEKRKEVKSRDSDVSRVAGCTSRAGAGEE